MMLNRWKSPLSACAVAIPLFGCATNPPAVPGQMTLIPPLSDQRNLWASYQQVLDQRIVAQLSLDNLTADRPASHRQTADAQSPASTSGKEVSRGVVPDQQIFGQRILAVHNQERRTLGLGPLRWNPALAQTAQRWADYLASTGRFEHAPENRFAPEGENLWAGTKGYFAPEAMVNAWIREKRYFRPGVFPDNSVTGRVEDVGHYTQVVWRATTQVGCAKARSRDEDILVCRYAEAGNYRGEQPF